MMELLASIAVIAILSVLIFVVARSSRESANQASCMNNLRQIFVAVQVYAADNDQKLPRHHTPDWIGWYSQLSPYLGDTKAPLPIAPRCPAFKPDFDATRGYSGYAFNANLDGMKIPAIHFPSQTPLFWEDTQVGNNNYGGYPDPKHGTGGTYCNLDFRHKGVCHALMLDGSIAALRRPASPIYSAKPSPKDFPAYYWKN